jgi:aspartyl-tRNA(Asn)/glutamyl-tRNA(Gln) amidotransferase subunit C
MSVTVKEVEYVAKLAKLRFMPDEMEKFTSQLNQILAYMEKLNELDTTNVEPLAQIMELQNILREDIVKPSLPVEEVLANAPAKNEKFFKVPKVISDGGNRK